MSQSASSFCEPSLVMVIEPETKTRFRYESEGGSHGGLTGREKINGKKTYPTVKLENYWGPSKDVFIRASLYTEQRTEHVLTFKKKKSSESRNYTDENLKEDYTAEFKNLTILSKKKEDVYQDLMDRKFKMLKDSSGQARHMCEKENSETVKKEAKEILNSVILRFDAFERRRRDVQICPSLYSEPICNQKASCKGDLKIHRMSKVSGSWKGEEEVILLCDKVQKDNIKILFYEKDIEDGWKAYASFNPADVHYQVAIPFRTPRYKENGEKEVAVALERQGELSEPRPFTYIPDDYPSKKRKMDFSDKLSSPMAISRPCSSTAAISDDSSSQEVLGNFRANQVLESQNSYSFSGDPSNDSFNFSNEPSNNNFQSNSSSEVDNFMLGLTPLELLLIQNSTTDLFSINDSDMETTDEVPIHVDDLFSLFPSDLQIDVGMIQGEMAAMQIQDSDYDVNIPKQKLKKYLHLISRKDNCGNTLLHLAVLHNKNIRIPIRMNAMANSDIINVQNCDGQTALHIAVEKNSVGIQRLLLNGSNPNIKNAEGNNCYHLACLNDFHKCLNDLLRWSRFPHRVNEFNYEGLTPLHIAIKKKSLSCFDILRTNRNIDLSVKEKNCDKSLLHYAVEYQPSFIFQILKEEKIDVNIQDSEGNTPLHIACAADDYETVKQLLLAKANPLIRNYKKNYADSEEENSDDETPVGQIPADLTKDSRILELLKQASEKVKSGFADSVDKSGHETLLKNLCNLLDSGGRWKDVAPYVLDEQYFDSLKLSSSPTRALLDLMKKQSSEDYIEKFKTILEMACFNDAVQMITESYQPLIVL